MKTLNTSPRLLCIALAAAFSSVTASAEDDVEKLTKPTSSVTLGVGHINTDNQRFGVHNGMAESGSHLVGEASILRRNDESGTWLRFDARNLGLPTRELRIEHEKQGDWGYYLDYSEFRRVAPYDVHTNLQGVGDESVAYARRAGTTAAQMNAQQARSTSQETEIKTDRAKATLGFMKFLNPQLELALKFQNEEKRGERIFGRGTTTPVQEFLAEPIDSTTRQIDLTLSYLGEKLQLTGGYYGSFYLNHNPLLTVSGGAGGAGTTPATAASVGGLYQFGQIALPPDNQAHQFYFSGGYDFTKTTRATFKYSHTKATQTDNFVLAPVVRNCAAAFPASPTAANAIPVNDSCRSDLGGRLDTTLMQAGISSRPIKNLSLLANLRYEDRNDKTPEVQYIAAGNTTTGFYEPRSLKTLNGKLEAAYQLNEYRLAGGLDYEEKERSVGGIRVVGFRSEVDELSYRAEVKRSLADSIMGTLAYIYSERDGSSYGQLRNRDGTLYANGGLLQPVYLADRDRHKFKLLTDWSPIDALSVQFAWEDARDSYEDRDKLPVNLGVRKGSSQLYSLDATYAVTDNWKLSAYGSYFKTQIEQSATTANTTATVWNSAMTSAGTNFGVGVKGKLSGKIDVGADLLWAEDRNEYKFDGSGVTAQLPDINWLQTTFKLYGSYAYDRNTMFRLDYVHDRRKTNDWTWANYTYTDGTWLGQEPLEKVHFLGASVQYSFR